MQPGDVVSYCRTDRMYGKRRSPDAPADLKLVHRHFVFFESVFLMRCSRVSRITRGERVLFRKTAVEMPSRAQETSSLACTLDRRKGLIVQLIVIAMSPKDVARSG